MLTAAPLHSPARDPDSGCLIADILAGDPSGAFGLMDDETRIRYDRVVRDLARASGLTPGMVANRALAATRAAAALDATNSAAAHVGYYLIGPGARAFARSLLRGRWTKTWVVGLPTGWKQLTYGTLILLGVWAQVFIVVYLASSSGAAAGSVLLVLLAGLPHFWSQSVQLLQLWLGRWFPLRWLPKLAFDNGIPDEGRTLIVIPTIVTSAEHARNQVAKLAELQALNADANLRFALLSDFRDCRQHSTAGDMEILNTLERATAELNRQHRDVMGDKFFVLHRERSWNPGEGVWMGWERKRGKLQELNRALRSDPPGEHFKWVFGDLWSFATSHPIRYVLTLDEDNWLEQGEAAQVIRTAAHPLNRPVFNSAGRMVEGYGILQPSIVTVPAYGNPRRLADMQVPPKTTRRRSAGFTFNAFDEGDFAGKALYDVDAFRACLEDMLPLNAVLSHDRLEGLYARAGEVCDGFILEPSSGTCLSGVTQRHRWLRGDTQQLPWLLPRVRDAHGRKRPNPLPLSARLTIARVFIAAIAQPARLAFLFLCWALLPSKPFVWPMLAFAVPLYSSLHLSVTALTRAAAGWFTTLAGRESRNLVPLSTVLANALSRLVLFIAFAPFEALIAADAVGKSLWRMIVSRRHLLEWTAQYQVEAAAPGRIAVLLRREWLWLSTMMGILSGGVVILHNPVHVPLAVPIATLWATAFFRCCRKCRS